MLTVATGVDAKRVADVFIRLRDANVEASDFSQQIPTLDDVFFKLTSNELEEG